MVVRKIAPTTSVVNSPPKVTSMVEEKQDVSKEAPELPVHPALAQVPEHVSVQNDFERVVFHHSDVNADKNLADLKIVAVNGYVVKEIDKPSVALRCHLCFGRAQFRLYRVAESTGRGTERVDMFTNKLVCEQHAQLALFPPPESVVPEITEEGKIPVVKEEDVNSTDSASTDGAGSNGSETGTVEVSEGKSDNGQTGEAVSDTP